ncbi:energy-coupling factor ABC transporter permease [Nereida sp. MMG025]|uniref:energy-coupling factor ABC transporter permease n=1 Tax=Nereida sp. MMG025 TaxID=2909981 RepID=UPI001F0264D8|nr:energy-coupling factor ABC transporter permease [Nereida sp. MMG025]MCF6444905.1 energy-coupling factor ABC transporter permease [Nereida sp. MMG025]
MHIEPGVVNGAKMALSVATAAGAGAYALKMTWDALVQRGALSLVARSLMATIAVFIFFEVLPHFAVGISEVHFILGTTILLILGIAPAAIGLALGLLLQGMVFAPTDLPMFTVNITTLLVPLFGIYVLAKKIIADGTAYVDLTYAQALILSATYQGGVVAWVAFWAIYGQGFGVETLAAVASFGAAYMTVLLIEPIADLAILAAAKRVKGLDGSGLVNQRLYGAA